MKRLSALLIGFIMIVGANSALALEGSTYNDPSMNAGITATQAWGHDKPAATNCSNRVIGLAEPSPDGARLEQVCLRDEVEKSEIELMQEGNGPGI